MDKTVYHPTQEALKEFWKWCGFKYEDYNSPAFPHQGGCWIDPEGKPTVTEENGHGFSYLPGLDFNNLFKYAVPQFTIKFGITKTKELLHKWVNESYMGMPKAEDLMMGIWEVIHDDASGKVSQIAL